MKTVILLFLLCLVACGKFTEKTKQIEILTKNSFSRNLDTISHIIILPNTGCSGCITVVEDFAKTNASEYLNVLFVFTKIVSKKTLKNKLGNEFLKLKNVYLDTRNEWASIIAGENEIYPAVLYLKNGKVAQTRYQSPKDANVMADFLKK